MAHDPQKPPCASCGRPLIWAPDVRRYFCNTCQRYFDSIVSSRDPFDKIFDNIDSGMKGRTYRCETCGNVMTFIHEHQKWYCYACQKYI
jgi:ribosomal protein S27AE